MAELVLRQQLVEVAKERSNIAKALLAIQDTLDKMRPAVSHIESVLDKRVQVVTTTDAHAKASPTGALNTNSSTAAIEGSDLTASTPTTCSTKGLGHDVDAQSCTATITNTTAPCLLRSTTLVHTSELVVPVATSPSSPTASMTRAPDLDIVGVHVREMSLTAVDMLRTTLANAVVSPTPSLKLFVNKKLEMSTPTRCSTICFEIDLEVLVSAFKQYMTPSIKPHGLLLRPAPWPSFKCPSREIHLMKPCSAIQGMFGKLPTDQRYEDLNCYYARLVLHWKSFSEEQHFLVHATLGTVLWEIFSIGIAWDCGHCKHLQQVRPLDQANYVAKKLECSSLELLSAVEMLQYLRDGPLLLWPPPSQEGFSQPVKGTSCIGNFTTGDLQLLGGAEYFVLWEASYGFYLGKLALMRKWGKADHLNVYCVTGFGFGLVQWQNMPCGVVFSTPSSTLQMNITYMVEQQSEGSRSLLAASELALCSMHKSMLRALDEFKHPIPAVLASNNGSNNSVGSAVLLQSVGSRQFLQHELLQPWPLPHRENARYGAIHEDKLLELMGTLVVLKHWLSWECFSLEENFRLPNFVPRALCDTSPWDPGDSKIRLWKIRVISQYVARYEFLALPWDPGQQLRNGHKCRESIASDAVICARYILDICLKQLPVQSAKLSWSICYGILQSEHLLEVLIVLVELYNAWFQLSPPFDRRILFQQGEMCRQCIHPSVIRMINIYLQLQMFITSGKLATGHELAWFTCIVEARETFGLEDDAFVLLLMRSQLNYTCTRHQWKVSWFLCYTILFCTPGRIFPWGSHQCQWRLCLLSEFSAAVMVECSADESKSSSFASVVLLFGHKKSMSKQGMEQARETFDALSGPQRHRTRTSMQVLVIGSVLKICRHGATPSFLMAELLAIGIQLTYFCQAVWLSKEIMRETTVSTNNFSINQVDIRHKYDYLMLKEKTRTKNQVSLLELPVTLFTSRGNAGTMWFTNTSVHRPLLRKEEFEGSGNYSGDGITVSQSAKEMAQPCYKVGFGSTANSRSCVNFCNKYMVAVNLSAHSVGEIFSSKLIQVGVVPLLGSKSYSGGRLEQLWDPGGNSSSVLLPPSLEEIAIYRGRLIDCQNLVGTLALLSSCELASFQGGRRIMGSAFIDHDYYLNPFLDKIHVVHAHYQVQACTDRDHHLDFVQAHLSYYYYYQEGYHSDLGRTRMHPTPWDPGGCSPMSTRTTTTSRTTSISTRSVSTRTTTSTMPQSSTLIDSTLTPSSGKAASTTTTTSTSLESPLTTATTATTTKPSIKCNGIRAVLGGVGLGSSRVSRREECHGNNPGPAH